MTTNSTSKLKAKDPKDVSPGKSKIMIFSRSGVGKTWFALDFPKPYYIDTEAARSWATIRRSWPQTEALTLGRRTVHLTSRRF